MRKKWVPMGLSLLLAVVIAACMSFPAALADETAPTVPNVTVAASYDYGARFSIPTGRKMSYGGQEQDASTELCFPSGKTYSSGAVTLDEEGTYVLTFKATFSGAEQKVEKTFTVEKKLFTVGNAQSSVEFGTYTVAEHKDPTLTGNFWTEGVTGMLVRLVNGDRMTYNKVINIKDFVAPTPFVEFVITPEAVGSLDVTGVSVILTDAYDPDNYVVFFADGCGADWQATYCRVNANGQPSVGYSAGEDHIYQGAYGMPCFSTFDGRFNSFNNTAISIANNSFAYALDYEERQAFQVHNVQYGDKFIADLDDANYVSTAWDGFTTGECFLSVELSGYGGPIGSVCIKNIAGKDFTEADPGDEFDREAPVIAVDFGAYDEAPEGYVGEPYPLFEATASSPYFDNLKVDYSVEKAGVAVPVTNGAFTPTEAGAYTVTVTVTTPLGAESSTNYTVTIKESAAFSLEKNAEQATAGTAGVLVSIGQPVIRNAAGNVTLAYRVTCDGVEVPVEGGAFRPTKAGTYTVTVTGTDYQNRTGSYSFDVEVVAGDKPVYVELPVLPKYFVSGTDYTIPMTPAHDYRDGSGKEVASTVTFEDLAGANTVKNGRIRPMGRAGGVTVAKLTYKAENSDPLVYEIPIIDVASSDVAVDYTKLFYVTDGSASVTADSKGIVMTARTATAAIDFINPLVAHTLEIKFAGVPGKTEFEKLILTLTDSVDPDRVLKLSYTTDAESALFSINGGDAIKVNKSLQTGADITLTLDDAEKTLKGDIDLVRATKIATFENGAPYTGFSSGLVYLSIAFEGAEANATGLRVSQFSRMNVSASKRDAQGPRLATTQSYGGILSSGSVFETPVVYASDLVSGKADVKLTVTGPNGLPLYSEDGILLQDADGSVSYRVKVTEIGNYAVAFVAVDRFNKRQTLSYSEVVLDETAPTITIDGTVPSEGKVGYTVNLPKATATDNVDAELTVYVLWQIPTGQIYYIDGTNKSFTPAAAGHHIVRYYCVDTIGNMTTLEYGIDIQ